MQLPLH